MNKLCSVLFAIFLLLSAIATPVSAATPSLSAKYNKTVARAKEFEVELLLMDRLSTSSVKTIVLPPSPQGEGH